MMTHSKSIVVGSLLFAVIASARPLFMGLDIIVVSTQFFFQNFALYAAVSLIVSAAGLEKYMFVVATAILAPIAAVAIPVFMNIQRFGVSEYIESWDFRVALGIAAFAFVGALAGSWSAMLLLNRVHDARA